MGIRIHFPEAVYIDDTGKFKLSQYEEENIINIEGIDYQVANLIVEGKIKYGGGNSYILKLIPPDSGDLSDDDIQNEAILKICKYSVTRFPNQNTERFKIEIAALSSALKAFNPNVIKIMTDGVAIIDKEFRAPNGWKYKPTNYLFYVMESAQSNLKTFLKENTLSVLDKLDLCSSILIGLSGLHKDGYYHRDIKHDNILFVDGEWKIGDLGLANNQNLDKRLDIQNEKIGPYGWLSPEVMNKVLTEGMQHIIPPFDCEINFHSDFFQIGKLIWYIFQGNLPIGHLDLTDFRFEDEELFELIKSLIQHAKSRRPQNIDEINQVLSTISKRYILSA